MTYQESHHNHQPARKKGWWRSAGFRKFYDTYMLCVGSIGQLLFYLQALKIYQTGSAHDISMTGFLIAFFSLSSWLFYGILLKNRVLIFVNIGGCLGAGMVIILKILADHHYLS